MLNKQLTGHGIMDIRLASLPEASIVDCSLLSNSYIKINVSGER
ncbi:hypothetical protein QYZ87_02285 [Porphyromonadaceae bacterium W3.11]|nr:hypothetical protein [Porphyromonadaceae bacterium W3.11]